jgi:type IV pilus assembly protein PilC
MAMTWDDWLQRRARVAAKGHRRITLDDKMAFFQQLGTLVSSGAPLLEAVQFAAGQTQSDRLRGILEEVAGRVSAGCPLNQALATHDNVFESHWIAMIATGEVSGKMDQVLSDLNDQIRDARETRRRIAGALVYPVILLVVAIIVIVVMLWFVVPTFGEMFEEMNAELPGVTRAVLRASDLVAQYGPYMIGGIVIVGFLGRRYYRTEEGLRRVKTTMMALPMTGDLMVHVAMHRFASNLAVLLNSGVPILESLAVLADVFRHNPAYRDAILHARNRLAAGRSLAESLEESGLFATMMLNAIRIGERSARLGPVMVEISPYYKEKMDGFLAKMTKLLEPCIIMGMGGAIAVLMLAIYLPMFEMAGKVN